MPLSISDLQLKANAGSTQALERRVALLESLLQVSASQVTLTFGGASVTLSATGNVTINGREISLVSTGKMTMKSSSDLTLKAAKINQN